MPDAFAWTESYWLVRLVFQRALAVVYVVAFLVAARQFRALAGEEGLLPLDEYVDRTAFRERPSLFHLFPDDRVVGAAAWTGVALAVCALLGVPYWLPDPYAVPASMLLWGAMWALYLSFVNAGRVFYGYGWESMLLETGFLAVFLGAGPSGPPVVVMWLLKWVLFRNMFGAGLIKIRGDNCWRELTCLDYHYETQPMPNPGSWYVHHLPERFHRLEALGNHVVELAVPFLFFAPQPYAAIGGVATIAFQLWLMVSGNFSWLNALSAVQAIATFSDGVLTGAASLLPGVSLAAPTVAPAPLPLRIAAWLVALVVLALSVKPVKNLLSESQAMNTSFDPLSLVNTYGAFGSVTRERYQLVVEGTNAADPAEGDWTAYEFAGQPVRTDERPPQWAPYHLRLDWQLWFAAMRPRPGPRQRWVAPFLAGLLNGDEATLSLVGENPFDGDPPERVRVLRYRYRFTTPEERAETGEWWRRERLGTYVAPVSGEAFEREERRAIRGSRAVQ
ncbi:lipase maturation factor family protein [Halogeometricum sp. S1BR25-6]|uniref:Lipase maturation factor family protein n=1 Tax=Halogeometricum salsisoli TaxID=2950536 RepID=A0ABU2GG38_9EURY|nr:lipase maturation factor family protein [Halogeometricum sp. S1BR25-6]MDS0299763.1 lipase maturation factor family protein [Halogeometricum sp. S1BR25-6]